MEKVLIWLNVLGEDGGVGVCQSVSVHGGSPEREELCAAPCTSSPEPSGTPAVLDAGDQCKTSN